MRMVDSGAFELDLKMKQKGVEVKAFEIAFQTQAHKLGCFFGQESKKTKTTQYYQVQCLLTLGAHAQRGLRLSSFTTF